ncbi:MAG: class I SAM-dependent DNA methyltransferase, partial [Acetobacteraceae bacterium]
ARYERAETQSFYNEFFEIFGLRRRRVAAFEAPVARLGERRGYIDLFWKGVLLVEQKSAGRDLRPAKAQALSYFPGLTEAELPRYILLSDFQTFELYDLDEGIETRFALRDLPAHIEAFGFIVGVQRRSFRDQDPVNIAASELMGRLHDALLASGYSGHDLEQLLVRLLFCLFADDTGIFEPRDSFEALIRERTAPDGADTGAWLGALFDVLNTPEPRRQRALDEDLRAFPYIDGALFAERLPVPAFSAAMRDLLLEACAFSWDAISPAIFGALFQSVMDPADRRAQGAHYTTEKNILKVIEPLFLDRLRAEFVRLRDRRDRGRAAALRAFQDRLAGLRFMDPACGCGNFLVIAYRELRALELEVLAALNPRGQRELDIAALSKVDVGQFYGIEINEFPARIAEVAMWMMDHIMNVRLSLQFGEVFARIPLAAAPHIHCADALELPWEEVLRPGTCDYILGNPPFVGFVMRGKHQQGQASTLMRRLGASGTRLDYVGAWFLKASSYAQSGSPRIGFVATNSITQGEQVAQLWPAILGKYAMEITFAHRPFAWGSDARGKAHVHCVVVGLARRTMVAEEERRLFSYRDYEASPDESRHRAISPYLFDASMLANPHLVVERSRAPGAGMPELRVGTKPVDGGYYILSRAERDELVRAEPQADRMLRPFIGSQEHLHADERWLLVFRDTPPQILRRMPKIRSLIEQVARYRRGEIGPKGTGPRARRTAGLLARSLADRPTEFHVTVLPDRPFLAIPETSSERRMWLPIAWQQPPAVPSNALLVAAAAELWQFALITARMHMAWMKFVGGRLESRYRYSPGICYNPFPWPELAADDAPRLARLAQAILDARAAHKDASLADLYDPAVMPPALLRAHQVLDRAVDRLYRAEPFADDRARVEHLFALYERRHAPLTPPAPRPRRG